MESSLPVDRTAQDSDQGQGGYRWPIVTLLFLPSLLTELLSSSMQPGLYLILSPFVVTMYGVGALLVRELTVRWGKGWPTVLVLGFAYGLCEEGLILKTCFDPKNSDGYGRWLGVNWIWTQNMNLWHAVFSIALPILFVHLMFPARQGRPWIGRRGLVLLAGLFVVDGAFINLAMAKYRPNPVVYPLLILAVSLLVLIAWKLPRTLLGPRQATRHPVHPLWLFLVGLFATPFYYLVPAKVQGLSVPPLVTLISTLVYVAFVGWIIIRLSGYGGWSPMHQFALACGLYGLYILGSPVAPAWVFLMTWHMDHIAVQAVFGVAAVLYIFWLGRRIRRYQATPIPAPGAQI